MNLRRLHPLFAASLALALLSWTAIAGEAAGGFRGPSSVDSADQLAPITNTVAGAVRLPLDRPVTVEYASSPKLTRLLQESLADAGFRMADADIKAVSIHVRGVLQLTGKHTARIQIAELAEKGTLIESADAPRRLAPADVPYLIAVGTWLGRLVDSGQLTRPGGAFLFVDLVGQATGAKDWFNRAVGGDRRGICLINCDNWNKTRQATFHVIEVQDGEGRERIEVRSELHAEELQPGRVVSAGLTALLDTLSGKPATASALPGRDDAKPQD